MAAKKKKVGARTRARAARPPAAKVKKTPAKSAATAAAKRAKAVDTMLKPEAAPEPSGAATIVYIHGIGNKPPASVLKGQWDQSLFEFDLGERTRMAYWVDRERYPVPLVEVAT